ncbi:MAG: CAP domain-containing protein [Anaerolineales bacterium]|nr:CAP domain-containing protein [Anaerolineales bacterium]
MKQNIRLSMFALCLLVFTSTKQTFALENNRFRQQPPDVDTASSMAARINAHREEAGLPPYEPNDALTNAAQIVADHMAATEFISHYDSTGASPSQRAVQAGYADHVTEIIYGGFGGADAAWTYWMENELHHSLILSEDYHEIGVGMAVGLDSGRAYWSIMLGTGRPLEKSSTAEAIPPGTVTKLPGSTSTAVPLPSPTADRQPTETPAEETTIALTSLETGGLDGSQGALLAPDNGINPTPAKPADPDSDESPWLILAAAATILAGIVFFYFPRARWARPSS